MRKPGKSLDYYVEIIATVFAAAAPFLGRWDISAVLLLWILLGYARRLENKK